MTGQWDAWTVSLCMAGVKVMTGLGVHLSLDAGLRIPDDPRTLTGPGDDEDEVVDNGDVTDDVELAGLMGTVDGA